ncbi:MAG: hypothetical protein R3F60_02485 [bacterium]
MRQTHRRALIIAALLGAGCSPEPEAPPAGETGPLGDLKLALAPPPEGAFDVAQIRFEVSAPGQDPQVRDTGLGGNPPEAAWLLALRPGPWHVTATPLRADGQPSEFCLGAEGDAQVRPRQTASLRLRMPCSAEGVGALDIGAVLASPPHIEEIEVERGSTRLCVGEVLGLAARVRVVEGPDPTMAWRVGDAADPLSYCALARGRQIAFSAAQAGDFVLHFTAENAEGEASLDVPVTVRDCDGPLLCPGEQVAVALPGGVAQGTCACEVQEGEPVEGVHLAELVVAPDHLRDRLPGLALVPVAPPACAAGAAVGQDARLRVARPGLVDLATAGNGAVDTAVAVFTLDGRELGCADDGGDGGDARLVVDLDAGEYLVRVVAHGEGTVHPRRHPGRGGAADPARERPGGRHRHRPPAHRPLRRLCRPRAPVRPGHRRARSPHPGRPPARGRRRRDVDRGRGRGGLRLRRRRRGPGARPGSGSGAGPLPCAGRGQG